MYHGITLVDIVRSSRKGKRLAAKFKVDYVNSPLLPYEKIVHFGQDGAYTYIDGVDKKVRKGYIARHKHEDMTSPMSPASLSRYILWGDSQDINANIRSFKRRYKV